ncbi:MAG: NUDIX domain-containing protein [Nitrospiraceae bacterium]|nr:MAG: NUDIX domain-containing protein [Nitrospiraceae bacterium]
MPKISAGIVMFRFQNRAPQVFLVHPGGPFWANKDLGAWSIPKGLPDQEENLLAAAQREFREETGFTVSGNFLQLTPVKQKSGKVIHAWAVEGDCNPGEVKSNTFSLEWPPRSGKQQEFPEVDRAAWFDIKEARERIIPGQLGLLEELQQILHKKKTI